MVSVRLPASACGPAGSFETTGLVGPFSWFSVFTGMINWAPISVGSLAQGCEMASAMTVVVLMANSWAVHTRMGVTTSLASLAGCS